MTNMDIIVQYIIKHDNNAFCDDCLSEQCSVKPRQQVNQICNKKEGTVFISEKFYCTHCGKIKKVRKLKGQHLSDVSETTQLCGGNIKYDGKLNMKQIFLISCAKKKQTALPSCPAEKMYISPLYREALSYALNRVEIKIEQVFILSALYGLLPLNKIISYYEKTLKNMSATERAEWGRKVSGQLAERFDIANTCFVFLAGEDYVAPLRKYLRHYSEPLKGIIGIGSRINWLKENLQKSDAPTETIVVDRSRTTPSSFVTASKNSFATVLKEQMEKARSSGASSLTITSKELHQLVGGYPGPNHKMFVCCTAMYNAMGKDDVIVSKPPSGKGASLKITYYLNNTVTATAPPGNAIASFVHASDLRSQEALLQVPDKPGWYYQDNKKSGDEVFK